MHKLTFAALAAALIATASPAFAKEDCDAGFKGHMANLAKVRDALRGWAMTHGYETVERPYEAWKSGIAGGFTEEGEYDVFWAVK